MEWEFSDLWAAADTAFDRRDQGYAKAALALWRVELGNERAGLITIAKAPVLPDIAATRQADHHCNLIHFEPGP